MNRLGVRPDDRVVVLTGAGISAESGLATFRDGGGLWKQHDVMKLATPEGFAADPALCWRFYAARRAEVLACRPNAGHRALVDLEAYLRPAGRFTLLTQNVDGLHQRAGSTEVVALHGSLLRSRCSDPACPAAREPREDLVVHDAPPRCDRCGAWLRPDVVLFGEYLDPALERAARAAVDTCTLFVSIGTSGVVWPAGSYAMRAAVFGARAVLVNLEPVMNQHFFAAFHQGRAAELLPDLLPAAP